MKRFLLSLVALIAFSSLAIGQNIQQDSPVTRSGSTPTTCTVGDAPTVYGSDLYICVGGTRYTVSTTASGGTISGLTANRAVYAISSTSVGSATTTLTELNYLSGVTSAVQTQLNAKISGTIATNQVAYGSGANAIQGSANFTYDGTNASIGAAINTQYGLQVQKSVSANADTGLYVQANATNGTGQQYGAQIAVTSTSGTAATGTLAAGSFTAKAQQTTNIPALVIGFQSTAYLAAASGTLGTAKGATFGGGVLTGAATISNFFGVNVNDVFLQAGGTVTKYAGLQVDALTTATNSTHLLLGTNAIPTGNYGAYIVSSAATAIPLTLKGAASQSASLSQWVNSSGTVLTDINSGGMLTIGTASTNLDRALWLKSPGYDTSTGLYGFYSGFTAPATATAYLYHFAATTLTAVSAYTLTNAMNFIANSPVIGAGSAITTSYGFYVSKQKVAGVTTGYGVYQADSADLNYFAGTMGIGTAAPTNYQLQVLNTVGSGVTSGVYAGSYHSNNHSPSGASTAQLNGFYGTATWGGTVNSASAYTTGVTAVGIVSGSASVYQVSGIIATAGATTSGVNTNIAVSAYLQAYANGGGTVSSLRGVYTDLQSTNASTVTTGYQIIVGAPTISGGGTIGTLYGLYLSNQGASGVTTSYGIRLLNQTGATTSYAIVSDGGASVLNGGSASVNILTLKEAASHTGNILDMQNSSGTSLSKFDFNANFFAGPSTIETFTTNASALGTLNYYTDSQTIYYDTAAATGNVTLNVKAASGTNLDSRLATGQAITFVIKITNTGTAYNIAALNIDGGAQTIKWLGGSAPSGNINAVDTYTFYVYKTGTGVFYVEATQQSFK